MPLDPQAQKVMDQIAALGLPPNHTVSPEEARANMLARPRAAGPEVAKVANQTIPNGDYQVPVRIYTPAGSGPFPILCWFHGGGWVIGNLETADATARHLAVKSECVVVSVDYRLAPESKFPVPFDDCYAATEWAAQNAAALNGDADRIAVGGDSAGGNLAAAVALAARDRRGPSLSFQLLVYPVTAPGLPDRLPIRRTPKDTCSPGTPCSGTGTTTLPATPMRPTLTPPPWNRRT